MFHHWAIRPTLSALGAVTSALDVVTSPLGMAISALARSFRRYRGGVSGNWDVGITPQICNRVTNHGDMGTFSRPDNWHLSAITTLILFHG